MGYAPSPRPTFEGATHIPYSQVTRHLWGDDTSGKVDDWIYVSSDKVHQLVFGLPPGHAFRHSDAYRTVFGADEVLYVLSGSFICANPETGEVQRAEKGEAVFFRRDTWHHGFSVGMEPLRVLEFFAPPPSTGSSGAYARTRPYIQTSRYAQDQWLGKWPMERAAFQKTNTMRVVRDRDLMWRLEGGNQAAIVGLYAATEHLTVGKLQLLPGQSTDTFVHGGDKSLYLLSGCLNVLAPENAGQKWFEVHPRDGFYLPMGMPHQLHNMSSEPLELLFGVAPAYLPPS
jgi:mannose-6-phosphate isomerase-like protein (cupin superfamily)